MITTFNIYDMKRISIKGYNDFIILERYDQNIKKTLVDMGVEGEELTRQVALSKRGSLGKYLELNGKEFTFGMLKAIFEDAKIAKEKTDMKKGLIKLVPRLAPVALAPFFPILAIIGVIFGLSRAFNKVFDPIFNMLQPDSKYSDFLKSLINTYMKIPEGNVKLKDRFSRAFVVSDRFIDIIKPEIIDNFTTYLSSKMEEELDSNRVPDHYIENELKLFINDEFDINPEIPLRD